MAPTAIATNGPAPIATAGGDRNTRSATRRVAPGIIAAAIGRIAPADHAAVARITVSGGRAAISAAAITTRPAGITAGIAAIAAGRATVTSAAGEPAKAGAAKTVAAEPGKSATGKPRKPPKCGGWGGWGNANPEVENTQLPTATVAARTKVNLRAMTSFFAMLTVGLSARNLY
jgi:hypothetical protein